MIRNYLKIAWRNLLKNRLTSFINIFGLGLSMSVGLMIMIRLQDQLSYDKFHPSPSSTFRITSEYQKKNDVKWKMASTPIPLNETLLKNTSAVENAVNIYPALNGKAEAAGKEISPHTPASASHSVRRPGRLSPTGSPPQTRLAR